MWYVCVGFAARLAVTMFPFFSIGFVFVGGKPPTASGRRNMLGFKSWWRRVRGGQSEQQQAEAEVLAVQQEVGSVQRSIMDQIAQLKQEQLVLRAELQEQVRVGAPRSALAGTTKKLKQTERNIAEKEKLCANVARERTQLADTSTNTQVASAMMRSVEAQQKLQKLDLGGVCVCGCACVVKRVHRVVVFAQVVRWMTWWTRLRTIERILESILNS